MGDFNAINSIEDGWNGSPVNEVEIQDFNNFLQTTGMTELKTVGRFFYLDK